MTSSAVWNLSEHRAHLNVGDLHATVDITRPAQGLHEIVLRGEPLSAAHLLATQFVGADANAELPIADSFVRGADLVVTYAPTETRPVRLQIYWRALGEAEVPSCAGGVDVQISVQTSLLHAWPALMIQTRLANSRGAQIDSASLPDSALSLSSSAARSTVDCWRCQVRDTGWAYIEMTHPADVQRTDSLQTADGFELSHHLFSDSLEKGVIVRARARGVFAPAAGDEAKSAELYQRFLAAPLPLTT